MKKKVPYKKPDNPALIFPKPLLGWLAQEFDISVATAEKWADRGYDRLTTDKAKKIIWDYYQLFPQDLEKSKLWPTHKVKPQEFPESE